MSYFTGEIRLFAGTTLPTSWVACDGASYSAADFLTLFTAIGTYYGGGNETPQMFNVPDFRGRVPIGPGFDASGNSYQLANTGGAETVQLLAQHLPSHSHAFNCSTVAGSSPTSTGNLLAQTPAAVLMYRASSPTALMNPASIALSTGAAHNNLQPYLALNYAIASEPGADGPFLGEVRIFPYNVIPAGWLSCTGQIMIVETNSALYAVLGNTFGGVASKTFGLPNLQACCAIGVGQGNGLNNTYQLGSTGGSATVLLMAAQNAIHGHAMRCVNAFSGIGSSNIPGSTMSLAKNNGGTSFTAGTTATAALDPSAIALTSATVPHNNVMPSLAFNFCICTSNA